MAKRAPHPGRTLVVFFLALAVVYGLVALAGTWKPKLGLDLQGGTRITLIATGEDVNQENLREAADIIDQRVNGSGVSEAEVTTQGNQYVVVEIPGESRRDLVDTVKRQAQLRFRVVAEYDDGGEASLGPDTANPGSGVSVSPEPTATAKPTGKPADEPTDKPTATPKGRAPLPGLLEPTGSPTSGRTGGPTGKAGDADASPTAGPTTTSTAQPEPASIIDRPLEWMNNPDPESLARFRTFNCPADGSAPLVDDNPDKPLVTCDDSGVKYLLSAAMIEGTNLEDANAGVPQGQLDWAVSLRFDGPGTKKFAEISKALNGTGKLFAIVLDGQVISAPTMNALITNGQAEITGDFSESEATSLATSLKFGALPIAFEPDPPVETIGPSLAGNQLSAGLLAGAAGLLVVILYCMLYYRGLGVVVLLSLVIAAVSTYGMVLLLSEGAGFTLSLPGIAGLIVAVGITADSFIVFFERIRDEMRDGKSLRVAVDTGWVRAKKTVLAADAVSLLAALVLYVFAAGVVKGFAFALGLSTLIDLAVVFWFTKPLMSWLATFRFFQQGHRLSGLDAENLGIDRLPGVPARSTAGGKA